MGGWWGATRVRVDRWHRAGRGWGARAQFVLCLQARSLLGLVVFRPNGKEGESTGGAWQRLCRAKLLLSDCRQATRLSRVRTASLASSSALLWRSASSAASLSGDAISRGNAARSEFGRTAVCMPSAWSACYSSWRRATKQTSTMRGEAVRRSRKARMQCRGIASIGLQ